MNRTGSLVIVAVAICIWSAADVASAQSTRDEVVSMGGKELRGAELKQLLSGKQISGPTTNGRGTFYWTLKSDGTFSGYGEYPQGNTTDSGSWSVNDNGQYCVQWRVVWHGGSDQGTTCAEWYRLGSDFYLVRDGRAFKRQVK